LSCACLALSSLAFILLVSFLSVADQHLLDKAKSSNGGSYSHLQVEGVKLVTRLTPFLLVMIPFWGIYNQTSTAFQNQGCQMNLLVGSLEIPVSALNIFDNISILMLVPVFDGYVYPKLKEKGYPLTMLVKMGKNHCFFLSIFSLLVALILCVTVPSHFVTFSSSSCLIAASCFLLCFSSARFCYIIGWGFVFAILAMVVAAIVEICRLKYAGEPGNYYDLNARDNITPCQNIDDYNPYLYQDYLAGVGNVDSKPSNCYTTCSSYYDGPNNVQYLNLTCIDCDNIPQMSHMSVFWQVKSSFFLLLPFAPFGICGYFSFLFFSFRCLRRSFNSF
jgi:hypothetical protein